MPILLTPAEPFITAPHLPAPVAYAMNKRVAYDIDTRELVCEVAYYASEAARIARAAPMVVPGLPARLTQALSPEEANQAGILDFLEMLLHDTLAAAVPVGTVLEYVA